MKGLRSMANVIDDSEEINIDIRDIWYSTDWLYRKKVVVDYTKVTGEPNELIDFPVLINITDNDLLTKAQTNGNDIVFVLKDGVTKLNHEIELYNTGLLITWIKIPVLSGIQDTEFYMYYGNPASPSQENPTAVWDPAFLGVYHMDGATVSEITDSTINGKHATVQRGSPSYQQPGLIGYAVDFTGVQDSIHLPKIFTTEVAFTASVLLWPRTEKQMKIIDEYLYNAGDRQGLFMQIAANFYYQCRIDGNNTGQHSVGYGTWELLTLSYDGTDYYLYVNGIQRYTAAIPPTAWDVLEVMRISDQDDGGRPFDGLIGDIRFSNISRGPGWVKTTAALMFDPNSIIIGPEQQI